MIRFSLVSSFCLIAFSQTAIAETGHQVPVETVDGQRLHLRGVSAEREESGLHTRGWVRRDPGNNSPVRAHLHVIALAADGSALQTLEAKWQGNLLAGVRKRRTVLFRVVIDPSIAESVARIRVSIEPGSRHPPE